MSDDRYLTLIMDAISSGRLGVKGTIMVDVEHDRSCGVHRSAPCGCEPDVYVRQDDGSRVAIVRDGLVVQ